MTSQLCTRGLRLLSSARRTLVIGGRRTLLGESFACSDAWRSRRDSPEFSELSAMDLGNRLLQALEKGQPVAPVDFDIYANKLEEVEPGYLEFFESVLKKFQSTQEALEKLDSTDHGLVRAMLALDNAELLVNWIRNKFAYGVFLDKFSASLLLDHLLESGRLRLAALVSFDLATQDSIGDCGDVCVGLMLRACSQRLAEALDSFAESAPASDSEAAGGEEEEVDEDDDDVEVKYVDCIRQPNYDDNFDIDSERLQLGKTMWLIGRHLLSMAASSPTASGSSATAAKSSSSSSNSSSLSVAVDCALLGLAAYERPNRVRQLLADWPNCASQSALADAERLLLSAPTLPDGGVNRPGRRPLSDQAAVRDACDAVRAYRGVEADWRRALPAFGVALVGKAEASEGAQLRSLYENFNADRQANLRAHSEWLQRRQLFRSVKADLDALVEEQEVLTSFDNSKKIAYDAWLAPRTQAERRLTSKKVWAKDLANVPRMVEEFYARQPATKQKPTTRRTKSGRIVLKEAVKDKRFRPLDE